MWGAVAGRESGVAEGEVFAWDMRKLGRREEGDTSPEPKVERDQEYKYLRITQTSQTLSFDPFLS